MDNDFKVLFISEEYPPTTGGVGVSSKRLSKNLARAGATVELYTFDASKSLTESDYIVETIEEGVSVKRIGPFFIRQPGLISEKLLGTVRATFRRRVFDQMERLAKVFKPDIVLSFNAVNAGLLGTYVARSLDVPHVVSVRGVDVGRNIFSSTELSMLKMIVDGSSAIACVNQHLRRRLLLAFPETAGRSTVIPNAVEIPFIQSNQKSREYIKANTRWAPSDLVAVFIGVPREKKGIVTLLRAIEATRRRSPIRLLIVGAQINPRDPTCGALVEILTAEGCLHTTGHIEREMALNIAAEGDLIVMPSLEDGMANGLLEGMALGLCPIVSNIFDDVVKDGTNGWVVPASDVAALGRALQAAVDEPYTRMRYAEASKQHAYEYHSPKAEVSSYISVLNRCLDQASPTNLTVSTAGAEVLDCEKTHGE